MVLVVDNLSVVVGCRLECENDENTLVFNGFLKVAALRKESLSRSRARTLYQKDQKLILGTQEMKS